MAPDTALPRATPESHGIPSTAILTLLDAVERAELALHSVMLVRHGAVLAEGWWHPYAPERPHMLFSLSKSFTSTAVGLAVAEGRLSVDDAVLPFFPDDAPGVVSDHLAAMRVRDLLSMATGHAEDTTPAMRSDADGNWARAFLAQPVTYAPGTHFLYNSGATYMLSAIVQRLTGATLLEYLRPRLLDPLGIEDATWESCPRGVNTGGWGLSITTESIARFGQLYLQEGVWRGQRLIPAAWVAAATAAQVSNGTSPDSDWEQGYGYQFWRCRHGAYRGDGAFGQFCVVMPRQDAVLAVTSGVADMQAVLNLVWAHLLPNMAPRALPPDAAAAAALADRLAGLALPLVQGTRTTPTAARVAGVTYQIAPNDAQIDSLALDVGPETTTLRVHDARGEHTMVAGADTWHFGQTSFTERGTLPVAAHGAWTADDTYELRLCFYETPFLATMICRFEGDRVQASYRLNVSFGPTELPPLEGVRAA